MCGAAWSANTQSLRIVPPKSKSTVINSRTKFVCRKCKRAYKHMIWLDWHNEKCDGVFDEVLFMDTP